VFCQVPVPSQVCTSVPLHRVEFGVQLPEHVPAPVQMMGHVCVVCQTPLELQVWEITPEHWVVPGTHDPMHAAAEQTKGQVLVVAHWPEALQL
jgi:hypothetical protein